MWPVSSKETSAVGGVDGDDPSDKSSSFGFANLFSEHDGSLFHRLELLFPGVRNCSPGRGEMMERGWEEGMTDRVGLGSRFRANVPTHAMRLHE